MSLRCKICCTVAVGIFGAIFLALGIGGSIFVQNFFNQTVLKTVQINGYDSQGYIQWVNNTTPQSAPQYLRFTLWNVTNPDDVMNGAKPIMKDIGPYSYREYFVNYNVTFNSDETQMTYNRYQYYVWDPETSAPGLSEDDVLNVVNVPFLAVLGGLVFTQEDPSDGWWQTLLFDVLASHTSSNLITNVTAKGLIFGYDDPLFDLVGSLKPGIPKLFQLQPNQTRESTADIPPNVVYTGKSNATETLYFIKTNGKDNVNCWRTPQAGHVFGGNGAVFPPGIGPADFPWTWIDQLFRAAPLYSPTPGDPPDTPSKPDGGTWVTDPLGYDIPLLRFTVPSAGMLNATLFPPNKDYFSDGLSGVANLTNCQQGAPIYISKPHFLDADPWFRERLVGMEPDPTKHNTFVDIETITGLALHASKKLQVNLRILPDFGLLYPKVIPDLYIPLAWIEEVGHLDQAQAQQIKTDVVGGSRFIVALRWIGSALGVAFVVCCIALAVSAYRSRHDGGYAPIGEDDTNIQ